MKKNMEKNSNFAVGDLVTIKHDRWMQADVATGIIIDIGLRRAEKQTIMFPACSVFNIKTSQIDRLYLYNLELLSTGQ